MGMVLMGGRPANALSEAKPMSNQVNVQGETCVEMTNFTVLTNCQPLLTTGSMSTAPNDVCIVPGVPPITTPFPNIVQWRMAANVAFNIIIKAASPLTTGSMAPMSQICGVGAGVLSGAVNLPATVI